MKKTVKLLLVFSFVFFLFQPLSVAIAQTPPDCDSVVTNNNCGTLTAPECMRCFAQVTGQTAKLTDTDQPFPVIVGNIIRGLLGFLGIIFLILIMYGGVLWMTSAGSEERITKAKKILANSAIGLFVIVVSFALATWIFDVIINAAN